MHTNTNVSAILAGDQRSNRFRYRHSVAGAAREIGIPTSWIWFWLFAKQLKSRMWLRKLWVHLESVQTLFADLDAVRDAFSATGDLLTSPHALQQVREGLWTEVGEHPFIKFQPPTRFAPRAASDSLASNPVLCEEVA
jgi:hypothetical protein